MHALPRMTFPLLLTLAAACGGVTPSPSPDAGRPDAGSGRFDAGHDAGPGERDGGAPDGGPWRPDAGWWSPDAGPGPEGVIDWRGTRGPALRATAVAELPGEPIALSASGFVTRRDCVDGTCTWDWYDRTGQRLRSRTGLRETSVGATRQDGAWVSLLDVLGRATCADPTGPSLDVWLGAWQLVDVRSGLPGASVPFVRAATMLEPAFLDRGGHARLSTVVGCELGPTMLRAAQAPWAAPPALASLPSSAWVDAELADGRFLVSVPPATAATVEPGNAASLEVLSSDAERTVPTGRFVHTYEDYPLRAIRSLDVESGATAVATLPFRENDWFAQLASDRYATACSFERAGGWKPCLLADGATGAVSAFKVRSGASRNTLALAGREGFLVYRAHDDDVYVQLDLRTGAERRLALPLGFVRGVGDGRAVLGWTERSAFLIERDRVREVPGSLRGLFHAGGPDTGHRAQAQLVFFHTVDASGGANWIFAWHVESGRLVWLTDSGWVVPPFGAPFTNSADCGAPGFVRLSGAPSESARQDVRSLHFTEFVPAANPKVRLFALPVDLSAPPRLLAELEPGRCGTPLESLDGPEYWLPVPTASGGVRAIIAQ